ncbi:MAG: HAD family phosphatase [Prevotellaceae bacterium]|nr:HAD family phosphatase [Prevotella sp.]MDD7257599.1 HAD family phosphatase [Prevotellaceae bacterium]MDY6130927.1 HAD family phosphatase [Prevotella sp.]
MKRIKAALFDLDGVILDTESDYSTFWKSQFSLYYPEQPGLEQKIKGQTLSQIFNGYFSGNLEKERTVVTRRLHAFENQMKFNYVKGLKPFVADLRKCGVKTAVVTSSNMAKMGAVYAQIPDFKDLFDAILTSEDFEESKPSPDCYQKAAARLGKDKDECVVFEDSLNGIRSGNAAEMTVVGLSTTNPCDTIAPMCKFVIPDYLSLDYATLSDHVVATR